MIQKIKFKNFKLFKEEQTLEIKPITIIIGKNNTGKTAVLHLPVIINNLLDEGNVNEIYKIQLNSETDSIELGKNFSDLVYGKFYVGFLEFEASNAQDIIKIAIGKDGLLELSKNEETIILPENATHIPSCEITKKLEYKVDYVSGIRITPQDFYPIPTKNSFNSIGLKGENAYPILINDFIQSGDLLDKVSEWYKNNFEGWKVCVVENKLETETNYSITISTNHSVHYHLKQAGQGIHQALPLITYSFMQKKSPSLIIIEEPETHLHPAAHANLAQRFVESYLDDKNKNYLIETHSLNFVLRVRRLVAERKLSHNDLKIYYVDYDERSKHSILQEIAVDAGGNVKDWPEGVFGESVLEARAIMNAKHNNLNNVD